jgi:sarcosine oxidase
MGNEMAQYQAVVVGAGMMGSSSAKYLAKDLERVALIGPGEPKDAATHEGIFASHYDAGRITRTIDPDADWALLANRSIARYAEIEAESGIKFYCEAGCLVVGPAPGGQSTLIENVVAASQALKISPQRLDTAALASDFSYFSFEGNSEGIFEKENAGHVNPRELVRAQCALAVKAGAEHIQSIVTGLSDKGDHVEVTLDDGRVLTAEKVLVSCGGFTNGNHLLPDDLKLDVFGRTIALFEVPEEDAHLYAAMPSLIYDPIDVTKHIYLVPPVRYPDGKLYLKIGGEPSDLVINNDEDMRAWFRSGGDEAVRQHLIEIVSSLIPSMSQDNVLMSSCVVSYTPSGYPAIGYTSSERIAVLAGGCGAAAKSCDEIGRLGAEVILTGRIQEGLYQTDFAPEFV